MVLGENQMMEVLILDQGTEQYGSVSSPPMVSLWWAGTSRQKKGIIVNTAAQQVSTDFQ